MKICQLCPTPVFSGVFCKRHYGFSQKGKEAIARKRISSFIGKGKATGNGTIGQVGRNEPITRWVKPRAIAYGRQQIQKLTKSKIKADLNIIFSVWRRMVDADSQGIISCCSCNRLLHWHNSDNSHYISRAQAPGLVFDEVNTGAACRRCNGFLEGNATGYRENLIRKHGKERIELLESQRYKKSGLGSFEMKILLLAYIVKFKAECIRLDHEPNRAQAGVLKRWSK